MTTLEQNTFDAVKSASRDVSKHIASLHNTDKIWEQRRYEIAKDFFVQSVIGTVLKGINADAPKEAEKAVACADILIAELKKAK